MNGEGVSQIVLAEEAIIGLLLIASLVAIFVRRYRLPYTVGLVGIGLLISAIFEKSSGSSKTTFWLNVFRIAV